MFHISSHYIGVSFSHFWTHQISVGYMVHKKWGQIFQSLDGFRSIHLWGGSNHWPIFTHIPRILQDSLDICGPLSGLQFKWTKWIYFTIIVGVNDLDYIGVKSSLISLLYTSVRAFLSQVSQFLARKKIPQPLVESAKSPTACHRPPSRWKRQAAPSRGLRWEAKKWHFWWKFGDTKKSHVLQVLLAVPILFQWLYRVFHGI